VAVKVYRPAEQRQFRNDAVYRAGRPVLNARHAPRGGIAQRVWQQAAFGMWVGQEWSFLRELHAAGIDVPRPIDHAGDALLMEYIGDESAPAEQLRGVRLTEPQAGAVWDRVVWNIKTMLQLNRVHGDLSPYNMLWHGGRAWIIDVPQMSDPREIPTAGHYSRATSKTSGDIARSSRRCRIRGSSRIRYGRDSDMRGYGAWLPPAGPSAGGFVLSS